jgi:dipeptidyl-peptidase-4
MGAWKIYKVDAETGESEIYFDYQKWNQSLPSGFLLERAADRTEDYKRFIFNSADNLYYFSTGSNELIQITDSDEVEKNPTFSPDGERIAYTSDNNLYVYDIQSGLIAQLTEDGSDYIFNGYASWVYYEEILGRTSRYKAYWWSPDSRKIAYLKFDDSPVPKFPLYRAEGSHGKLEWQRYPKSGDPNPVVSLGVFDLEENKLDWIVSNEEIDYVAWPAWTPDSKKLFYQWVNRGQDSISIYSYDLSSGEKRIIYTESQDSWVEFFEDLYMFQDNSGFIVRSDKEGWRHLYYYDPDGNLKQKITDGNWRVYDLQYVDEENKKVYFHASLDEPTEKHFYVINLDGTGLKKLTDKAGYYTASASTSGNLFYARYSNLNTPAKLKLYKGDGEFIRELGDSKSEIYDDYKIPRGELFWVETSDGVSLPVKWYLPPDFEETNKYPVIIYVYGGPGSASVYNSYPMFRSPFYYAQNNIIYLMVDHRGSAHFGKEGESRMHRNLGKWEMNDYIEVVKWLRTKPFIDSAKIGITGGSYGGYAVCMALTYGADYFTHGIAQLSVTNWHLYDNFYTERFMDKPSENREGYKFGSAMTHAANYKGKLMLVHGTMDDNVHMQNTIQLVDRLTDLNKDFDLLLYPNSRHGIGMPKRRHLSRETVEFWFKYLLDKEFESKND